MAPTVVSQVPARIRSLDILRGVGVLGMLAVHIQLFAFPSLARWNPTAYGNFTGLNWWVWLATSLLADGKFITIFAMLLGASIVMMAGDAGARAIPAWRTHMRRMTVLLILGLLHAHLLWYGDMLVPLALSGAVVFFARRLSPRRLLVLGGLAFATASVLSFALDLVHRTVRPGRAGGVEGAVDAAAARSSTSRSPSTEGGGPSRWPSGCRRRSRLETVDFVTRLLWQMTGLMLMGMALFKLGVLSAARSRAFYRRMASLGFGAGHPVDLARALAELRDGMGPPGLRAGQSAAALLG